MGWTLAIADDLTGALEAGARFGRAVVSTAREIPGIPECGVLAIDTETRHVTPEEARAVLRELILRAIRHGPAMIYKKTDSTLRGNIAAEFQGMLDALPEQRIVYVAAYPELGRTVRNGRLFVNGAPVEETAFNRDPLNPVRSGSIAELVGRLPVTIPDAETEEEVRQAAREILAGHPPPIAAGPAGLAGWLRKSVTTGCAAVRIERCLVVNGSLHPASAAQIEAASRTGLFDGRWVLCDRDPETVKAALAKSRFDSLAVFGGDTAFAIHRGLNFGEFETMGEVLPGVPVSRCGGLTWITKAGGFGAPELLCDIRRRVS
ncbi:MAG: hypothetical protein KGN84_13925 [Acidobacteriota bacterium]|nr:hypothetical protein [Acidobacteriota bacterium]